jgi:MFS family permease
VTRAPAPPAPWLIVGLAFLTVGVAFGCRSAFAVFLVAVIREFGWSRGATSGVLFLGALVWSAAATFIGILMDRFGPRLVLPAGALVMALGFVVSSLARDLFDFYIGIGVLMALGFAALPMSTHGPVISRYFQRRRGWAMGIAASGMGIGVLTIVPLAELLISSLGWRSAYLILAGLLAGVIAPLNLVLHRHGPPAAAPAESPASATPETAPRPEWTLERALRSHRFWALGLGVLTGAIPLHMILIHQVAAVVDAGFSPGLAASVMGMNGLFIAPSMIFWGALSDRIGREWAYTLGSLAMIAGIVILLQARAAAGHAALLYAYAVLFALGFATRQALYPAMAADLFHGRHFGAINGALTFFVGAGSGIGPWLGGYLFDRFGSYLAPFWLANLLALASIALIWVAAPRHGARRVSERSSPAPAGR